MIWFRRKQPWQLLVLPVLLLLVSDLVSVDAFPTTCFRQRSPWAAAASLFHSKQQQDDGDEPSDNNSSLEDEARSLRLLMAKQQKQIDMLLKLVQQQQPEQQPPRSSGVPTSKPVAMTDATTLVVPKQQQPPKSQPSVVMAPCKVMLFIDGTWLYYSLHERRESDCPIIQKYGRGWQQRHAVDWEALPRIVCQAIQNPALSWTTHYDRPLEVVRASVFTSYKADTSTQSFRYQMFQEMQAANYDVHMMETVGKGEKCVDIQLAVEMLHYATVPHAYDVALLLTGDKDFMPAMIRTRQKGRKVGLVSMRRGCNRALFETPGLKDYEVIWLEDYLEQWIKPNPNALLQQQHQMETPYSQAFFIRILYDFIVYSGFPRVSSRDLGRYFKFLQLPRDQQGDAGAAAATTTTASTCVLDELKRSYGGLSQFINSHDDIFELHQRAEASYKEDPSDKSYWISLLNAKRGTVSVLENNNDEPPGGWSEPEQAFFRLYNTEILTAQRATAYYHTLLLHGGDGGRSPLPAVPPPQQQERERYEPAFWNIDYSQYTVKELKDYCRERGLLVSGLKSDLVKRVQLDVEIRYREYQQQEQEEAAARALQQQQPQMPSPVLPSTINNLSAFLVTADPASTQYLTELIVEYVKASGGSANSRDLGRYLAANKASTAAAHNSPENALQELKLNFGNLGNFVLHQSDKFVKRDEPIRGDSNRAFTIDLRK